MIMETTNAEESNERSETKSELVIQRLRVDS